MSEVTVTHKPARMMEGSFEIRVGGSLVGFTKYPEVAAKIGAVDELLAMVKRFAWSTEPIYDMVDAARALLVKVEGKV